MVPPFDGVAVKVTADPGQKGLADAAMVIPAGKFAFTNMVIGFDGAGFPDAHVSEDDSEQVTTSPFTGEKEKTGLLVPSLVPFTFHWYTGIAPPFMVVEVKVIVDPKQKGFEEAMIVTPTGNMGFTIIATTLEIAGFPEGQKTFEFKVQVIVSLLTGMYE